MRVSGAFGAALLHANQSPHTAHRRRSGSDSPHKDFSPEGGSTPHAVQRLMSTAEHEARGGEALETNGSHPVATVTFVREQKLSNDAVSKDEVVISPEVPGGVVTWTARLELNGKEVSEVSQQVIDFGR